MNERIFELAKQADLIQWDSLPSGARTPDHESVVKAQKFAELIVRECCIALNPMLRDMISRGHGVDMIKLHFGMNPNEITTRMLDTAITQCEQELAKRNPELKNEQTN